MKYLKTILFTFILIIILSLITTILYYFNITSTSANNVLRIISFIIIFNINKDILILYLVGAFLYLLIIII